MSQADEGALAEAAEAEFMFTYLSNALPLTRATLGVNTQRLADGVVLSMRNDTTGHWNKAVGFGRTERVTVDLIDGLIDFYRAERSPIAVIQIAPGALPRRWSDIVERHDLRADSRWLKLVCRIEDARPRYHTDLRVGPVGSHEYRRWAATALQAFGMPEYGLVDMLAESQSHSGFHPVAAWDGNDMVAAANLFIHGQVGSLNTSATLVDHRNRGAQSALIAQRVAFAADAGCRLLCAETGHPEPGASNTALENLRRSGFRPLYRRQNWVWSRSKPS